MARIAAHLDEWAGMPTPVDGEKLIIADGYPFREAFQKTGLAPTAADAYKPLDGETHTIFWSSKAKSDIAIFRDRTGKVVHWGQVPTVGTLDVLMRTLGCSVAWSIEAEANALHTLGSLIRHHTFKYYLLTGMFLETSKRSGVTYLFRKLRPTIALKAHGEKMHILCGLCMHSVGYYQDTYAGALCPTDDVISHLLLARSDEKLFWRRCNQHPVYRMDSAA